MVEIPEDKLREWAELYVQICDIEDHRCPDREFEPCPSCETWRTLTGKYREEADTWFHALLAEVRRLKGQK